MPMRINVCLRIKSQRIRMRTTTLDLTSQNIIGERFCLRTGNIFIKIVKRWFNRFMMNCTQYIYCLYISKNFDENNLTTFLLYACNIFLYSGFCLKVLHSIYIECQRQKPSWTDVDWRDFKACIIEQCHFKQNLRYHIWSAQKPE